MTLSSSLLTNNILINNLRRQMVATTKFQPFKLYIGIDYYPDKIKAHYQKQINADLETRCHEAQIPSAFGFKKFGLIFEFEDAIELSLHDTKLHLIDELKPLVKQFGVLIFRNAYLHESIREMYHRNNFPHLNFHVDRHNSHENNYSLYTRDPFDEEQKYPRKASTLFIDNSVAYLQANAEGILKENEIGRRSHYNIFKNSDIETLFGKIILEQTWSAPAGQGEIGIIDNHTVLHSSYKHGFEHGYSIGARYLY